MKEKPLHDKGRKWLLTINNPLDHNMPHEEIKMILEDMDLDYWCMCDEVGNEDHTPHTHIYVYKKNTLRFKTVKNNFPVAHIDWCYGSTKENRDYIRKEGKYLDSEKKETNLIETFEESGVPP